MRGNTNLLVAKGGGPELAEARGVKIGRLAVQLPLVAAAGFTVFAAFAWLVVGAYNPPGAGIRQAWTVGLILGTFMGGSASLIWLVEHGWKLGMNYRHWIAVTLAGPTAILAYRLNPNNFGPDPVIPPALVGLVLFTFLCAALALFQWDLHRGESRSESPVEEATLVQAPRPSLGILLGAGILAFAVLAVRAQSGLGNPATREGFASVQAHAAAVSLPFQWAALILVVPLLFAIDRAAGRALFWTVSIVEALSLSLGVIFGLAALGAPGEFVLEAIVLVILHASWFWVLVTTLWRLYPGWRGRWTPRAGAGPHL